jgi:hypothetical protein
MLCVVAIGGPAVAGDMPRIFDDLKAAVMPDEIVLTGTEMKSLYDGAKAREYRVCVKSGKESAPMKVVADGDDLIVSPGGCEFVTGRRISATPAQPLAGRMHIVATFHHEKSP